MSNTYPRLNQWHVTATVAGRDIGIWTTQGGGDANSGDTKIRPGALLGAQVSIGGPSEITNVTLTREWDSTIDPSLRPFLIANRNGPGSVHIQQLDENNVPQGTPTVYTGILLNYQPPKPDKNGTGASTVTVEFSVTGIA